MSAGTAYNPLLPPNTANLARIVATSTTAEHLLTLNANISTNDTVNVLAIRHTDSTNGCSALRFLDPSTSHEYGAVGFAAPGAAGGVFRATYLEASDVNNEGSGFPLRLVQTSTLGGTKSYGPVARFEISAASGGAMTFYNSTGTQLVQMTNGYLKAGTTTATCQVQASCDFGFTGGGFRNLNPDGVPDSMFGQATDGNLYILTSGWPGGSRLNILAPGGASQFLFDCSTGQLTANGGNKVGTNGVGVSILRHGTATLAAGTVTVTDANVTANSRIFVNRFTDGGTVGDSYSITRSAGVSFTITSKTANVTQTLDTSVVAYEIINP